MIDKNGSFPVFFNMMAMCRVYMTFCTYLGEYIEMNKMDYLIKVSL
ncbi:hypothetical protein bcere0022_42180 [Bacillus cereus Rock3-44]|nr:hypothetical protein bcere0022_42180 [Bacillus cereus Rock3-44]